MINYTKIIGTGITGFINSLDIDYLNIMLDNLNHDLKIHKINNDQAMIKARIIEKRYIKNRINVLRGL